jgi:heme iron utilization protein
MDDTSARALRCLVDRQPVAALGTLHRGEPAVSMVPFTLARLPAITTPGIPAAGHPCPDVRRHDDPPDRACPVHLVIHVSGLASHTRNLNDHPRASVLVVDELAPGASPLALPRVSFDAEACLLDRDSDRWTAAREAYLARLPEAEDLFELGDFRLVALKPLAVRLVAGFGRAGTLTGDELYAWLLSNP